MNEEKSMGDVVRAFHEDEAGLEVLQVVLIIALAAIIFIAIKGYWNTTKTKGQTAVTQATQDLTP